VAKYCDEHVCLFVRQGISGITPVIFTNFSVHVTYGRGLVIVQEGDEIPRGRGSFGVFFSTDKVTMHCNAFAAKGINSIANNVMQ